MNKMMFDHTNDFGLKVGIDDNGLTVQNIDRDEALLLSWDVLLKKGPASEGYWLTRAKGLSKAIEDLKDEVEHEKGLNRMLRNEIKALHRKLGE